MLGELLWKCFSVKVCGSLNGGFIECRASHSRARTQHSVVQMPVSMAALLYPLMFTADMLLLVKDNLEEKERKNQLRSTDGSTSYFLNLPSNYVSFGAASPSQKDL